MSYKLDRAEKISDMKAIKLVFYLFSLKKRESWRRAL